MQGIIEIYNTYNLMPTLVEHQLRVGAVAKTIMDNLTEYQENNKEIVTACLLHDMGNIIKFDLQKSKEVLGQEIDVEYWQKVKAEFVSKYGKDEHHATLEIAKEIGVGEKVLEYINAIGFHTAEQNKESKDMGRKICAYSDMRVWPLGVVPLEKRLKDLRVRYELKRVQVGGTEEDREKFENSLREIEKQIFAFAGIQPGDITEASIKQAVLELKSYEI